MVWLLSMPRGDSDDRGLAGGVGEAGEVGGLGVAHCTGNRNEQGSESGGWGGGVRSQGPAPVGREQGRRQAGRRAEPGALLKLRQSLPGSRCCEESMGPQRRPGQIQALLRSSVTVSKARPL